MKKLTSLFCALMLMMSASAMGNDARTIEMKHRQAVMREAMIRNNGQLPVCVKAPQQTQEVYNLTVLDKPYLSPNTWGEVPQLYISMTSEENYGITLYINGITEMENGKTYTYADMDDWSSIGNYNTYQYSGLADAAITWSQDAEGLERYEGFVSDTLGNRYNFLYQEKKFAPTGDTIQVSYSRVGNFEYSSWSQYWNISGYDNYGSGNPYSVYFALNIASTESPAGHFTEADFADPQSNHIYVNYDGKPSKDYHFRTADITIVERNDSLLLNAYALADDGNVYDIYIYYADPKPLYEQTLNLSMTVDTSGIQWGSVSFKGANEDYEVSINVWMSSEAEDYHGTYEYNNCYPSIYNVKTSEYISIFSGSVTVAAGENGDVVTGSFLGWDNTLYKLNMTEGTVEKTREEVIMMNNAGLYIYEDQHKYIIWGCNEDSSRIVSISILSDVIAGTYTLENLELNNTYVGYDWNEMGHVSDIFHALDANFTVTYDETTGTVVLAGTMLAQSDYHVSDVPEFTLLLKAELTHPHLEFDTDDADFEAVYNGYELIDGYANGYVIVTASNETSQAALAFFVAEGATSFTPGTYTCSLKGEPMSVYTGSCDGYQVYVSFFMDSNYNIWFPYAGTATVDENGVIVFDALNSYDRTIKVTLNPKKEEAIQNVEEKATSIEKRIENGMLIIEKNGVMYNVIGTVIK